MSKSPAFLMYSKDWLQGTVEMTSTEKGVFIDLLCHQHNFGSLPSDMKKLARLAGMSLEEFNPIWKEISSKFTPLEASNEHSFDTSNDVRIVNQKLVKVMSDAGEKSKKNKIISIFGKILGKSELTKKEIIEVKKQFKVNDFINFPIDEISERMTEWYIERCNSIANANAHVNEYAEANGDRVGGLGEGKEPTVELPAVYRDRPVFVPEGWPVKEFSDRWNAHRVYRNKQHGFKWKDPESEQKAITALFNDCKNESFDFVKSFMDFCESKGWKGFFIHAYREQLTISNKTSKSHNDFDKKVVPV